MKRIRNIVQRDGFGTLYTMERATRRGLFVSCVNTTTHWTRTEVAMTLRAARRKLRCDIMTAEVNGVPDEPY